MDGKQDWEWLTQIEKDAKFVNSTFAEGTNYEQAFCEDAEDKLKLIACIRTLREALELIAENEQWSKNGPNRACGIGCDGIKGDDGIYSPQNGHEDRCLIYGARAALEKAAKGEFE